MQARSLKRRVPVGDEDWEVVLHSFVIPLKHSKLTKIFSSPDVHLSIIFSQVVKPGLVNHKDASCYDRGSGKENTSPHKIIIRIYSTFIFILEGGQFVRPDKWYLI